jgi:CDP-diacylglycerol--serine O-phosphatidyltransferase
VPTPAVGLLIASLPLIYWNNHTQPVVDILFNKWFLYALIAVLSWLMVSNLPIMAMKFRDYRFRSNLPRIILLAVAVGSAFIFQWLAVPVVFIVYIILSLTFKQSSS